MDLESKSGLSVLRRWGVILASAFTVIALGSSVAPAAWADRPVQVEADSIQVHTGSTRATTRGEERIIGGWPTDTGKWPSIVSLAFREDADGKPIRSAYWGHYCGGVLITRTWVLTAAHCVDSGLAAFTTDVVVGRTDLTRPKQGQRIPVRTVREHPRYGFMKNRYDFALLKLVQPARGAQPLGLSRLGGVPRPGAQAEVAGWGVDQTVSPSVLHETVVDVQEDRVCADAYYDRLLEEEGFFSDIMVCAGAAEGGRDSCQGDSGGPLMSGGQLIGIVSFGIGCGLNGYPGVYAEVERALPWVERVTKTRKLPRAYNQRPIREKAGWAPRLVVDAGVVASEWVDSYLYQPYIAANRYVTDPTLRLDAPSDGTFFCPGWLGDYPFDGGQTVPDERCQYGQGSWTGMPRLYGGMAAAQFGWSTNSCVPLNIRAIVEGVVRQFDFSAADCKDPYEVRRGGSPEGGLISRPVVTPHGLGREISRRVIFR